MSACIDITAYQSLDQGAAYDRDYTVSARLLTDELRQLIERQNIDCSDINCMKWPIMGMSRHATCKVLLLKSDLHNLLTFGNPSAYSGYEAAKEEEGALFDPSTQLEGKLKTGNSSAEGPEYTEYRIWFSSDPNEATYFNRMHLADIQPLMVSGFGNPEHGEALYIVTFKCFRWARRAMSFVGLQFSASDDHLCLNYARNGTYPNQSTQPSNRSVLRFYAFSSAPGWLGGPPKAAGVRNVTWEYNGAATHLWAPWAVMPTATKMAARFGTPNTDEIVHVVTSEDVLWDEVINGVIGVTPLRLDSGRHAPYQSILDEVLCDTTSAVYSVIPFGLPTTRGQYRHTLMSLGFTYSGELNFVNRVSESIIAGTLGGNLASRIKLNDTAVKYIVPMHITSLMTPPCGIYGVPTVPPNGDAPALFDEYKGYKYADRRPNAAPSLFGRWSGFEFPHARHKTLSLHQAEFGSKDPLYGNGGWGEIISDFAGDGRPWAYWPLSISQINDKDHPNRVMARRLSIRYQIASQNAADIWVRGWVMPKPDELEGWMQWIELRLQTDGKGFGFPTTRIWFDRNDPLVCPQFEDGNGQVKGLGLIKTWKGFDGKDRVCLDYPFGIPCLIMIIDNERITPGVDAWRYTCVFVQKSNRPDEQIIPPVTEFSDELYGGLEDIRVEDDGDPLNPQRVYERESVAYNLAEAANRSDFTAPGYKKPITQPGFNVLPIGQDKDGNKRHVVVQGFIYRGGEDHRTCVYFSMPNAIDGDCP